MTHLDKNEVYMDTWLNVYYPPGAHHGFDAPEELKDFSSPYWYTFPPVHPFVTHLFGILFFFLWVVSTVGNGTVFYIFLKTKSLRTPSNMLIVSLAVSDLIMIWTLAPPLFVGIFLSKYWAFGEFACKLYGFMGGLFGTLSLLLIICIGFDRYNVIVNGMKAARLTPLRATVMILTAFLYSALTGLPAYLEVWGKFALEGLLVTCSFDYLSMDTMSKAFSAFYFFFDYLFPLLLICYFYSYIVKAVVVHEANLKKQAKKMNVESLRSNKEDKENDAQMRIAKVALTAVCLWLFAWTPYAMVVMLAQFGPENLVTPIGAQIPSFLAKVASCINPIIYAISHPKYREALAKECACFGIGRVSKEEEEEMEETRTKVVSEAE